MTTYRRLEAFKFKPAPSPSRDVGKRPEFRLLPIDQLVVDDRYQRPITGRGRGNIVGILECFDWRKFEAVVVTPIEDGLFAIIDGQHRATAALMHPRSDRMVPCMVVNATPQEAAECFAAINGRVTSMTLGQMFHARVAAGEHWALQVKGACDEVGAQILKAKSAQEAYRVGETMAVGTIERCLTTYGGGVLRLAMRSIIESGDGNAGLLNAVGIRAMCIVVDSAPRFSSSDAALITAMGGIGFRGMLNSARAAAVTERRPAHDILASQVAAALLAVLDPKARSRKERVPA